MKKTIPLRVSIIFACILIFFSTCKKENKVQEINLSSGTSADSRDGFRMNIKISGKEGSGSKTANAETKYISDMGSPQKVLVSFVNMDIRKVLLNDSLTINVDSFRNIVVHPVKLPPDGKKYWFIPFDPGETPRLANSTGGNDAIGCCCGQSGDGCYVSESGQCLTKVCLKCTNAAISFDASNSPSIRSLNKGFTVVQADIVVFNGVSYK